MAIPEINRTFGETYPGLVSSYTPERLGLPVPVNFLRFMNLLTNQELGIVSVRSGEIETAYTVSPDSSRSALILATQARGGSGDKVLAAERIIFF